MMNLHIIKVGMADLQVAKGEDVLKTVGLGSCVGLTMHDFKNKVGGMAHIMLPSSHIGREENLNEAKYADTAISAMLLKLLRLGAEKSHLVAKMAGGAQMFAFSSQSDMMRIGQRNVAACKEHLQQHRIPIIAEDTGGNYGRTIELHIFSGVLVIRSVNKEAKEI